MMILTRKSGESIQIGPDVTIHVMEMRGEYVRLGIEAPREMIRPLQEIYTIIGDVNRASSKLSKEDFASLKEIWLRNRQTAKA